MNKTINYNRELIAMLLALAKALILREGSSAVLEGQGWITINVENVDSFGF